MVLMNNYSSVRVGVAGATGYAGLELLRRLSRHPGADVRRDGVGRLGGRSGCRRSPRSGTAGRAARHRPARPGPMPCSSRCPKRLRPSSAPALADAGHARLRSVGRLPAAGHGRAAALVSALAEPAASVTYGLTERYRVELADAQAGRVPGLLSDGRDPVAAAAGRGRAARAGHHHRREVRHLGGGQDAERAHALLRDVTAAWPRTACSRTATRAEIEQELGVPVTFVPHLVPLDRGILETIYARLRPGVDAAAIAGDARAGLRRIAVRPADRRGSAGDQARRAYELLRHRLARSRRTRSW